MSVNKVMMMIVQQVLLMSYTIQVLEGLIVIWGYERMVNKSIGRMCHSCCPWKYLLAMKHLTRYEV